MLLQIADEDGPVLLNYFREKKLFCGDRNIFRVRCLKKICDDVTKNAKNSN